MTLPLVSLDVATPEQVALLAATPPINLFRLLAQAPGPARRVAALGATLMDGRLSPLLRELVALRIARRRGGGYVEGQHQRLAERLGLRAALVAAALGGEDEALSPLERDVLQLADRLAANAPLEHDLQDRLIEALGAEGLMTLAVTAGYFTMVSAVTSAFSLPLEAL